MLLFFHAAVEKMVKGLLSENCIFLALVSVFLCHNYDSHISTEGHLPRVLVDLVRLRYAQVKKPVLLDTYLS